VTTDDTADSEESARVLANCRWCELAIALELLLITNLESPLNPITNPNPLYNQKRRDDIKVANSVIRITNLLIDTEIHASFGTT
jgi:hypothetical protein